jgi:conjugative relaxase-like TrwC/TraI family protein
MLGMHRLTSNRAAYYLSDLARELPVAQGPQPIQAVWTGQVAAAMGLHGAIDPDQFRAVLEGRHPHTGRSMRSNRATVLGYDLTFSAPKSASVLYALGGEEVARHIVAAHMEAVGGGLTYLESHGITATRGSGERREVVPTTGLVAGSFTHGVSRNLDPHLHSHVVMANLVQGEDGRWSACDQRGIVAHGEAASVLYDAHLRAGMTARLGVRWSQAPQVRAEVDGVSPLLLGEFSSRAADIRRHMAEMGAHSSRGHRIAWAVTRPAKGNGWDYRDLSASWDRRALAVAAEPIDLAKVLGRAPSERPSLSEHQFAAVLSLTPHGGARRRDVITAFGAAARDGAAAPSLQALTDMWVPQPTPVQVGVSEEIAPRRTVVPGRHVLRALGPRPLDPADHRVWRDAARAIDDYRVRWGVTRTPDVLGVDSTGLAALPTARVIDHLRTEQHVAAARARLGRREPHIMELDRAR